MSEVSRYHVESALAATQVSKPFDWSRVVELYDQLVELHGGSPVVQHNSAVALARLHGPEGGLAAIEHLRRENDGFCVASC